MMRRTVIGLILFAAGALSAGVLLIQHPETSPRYPVSAPKLAKVEAMAELVTLRTRITDVQVTEITGYTSGVRCILVVPGSAGEAELVNWTVQRTERIVSETAKQKRLQRRAQERAAHILQRLFKATGWRVRVVWAQR